MVAVARQKNRDASSLMDISEPAFFTDEFWFPVTLKAIIRSTPFPEMVSHGFGTRWPAGPWGPD